jgi:TrmH family RNA methyltransferase
LVASVGAKVPGCWHSAMAASRVTSKEHPLAKKIRLVASRARRAPRDLVLAEGIRVLEEATHSKHEFEAVLLSDQFGLEAREKALLETWHSRKIPVRRAVDPLFRSLSDVLAPQGALALVRVPQLTLTDIPATSNSLVLCACGIQDPGNLGTLLRTAAAAGVSLVCTTPETGSLRNPKAIRSSAGAFFRIPVVERVSPSELRAYCSDRSIPPLRTEPRSGASIWETNFRGPAAILLGSETRGLRGKEWSGIPAVHIPMIPGSESLNVAAAGAIILFEACRQRSSGLTIYD